MNNRRESGRNKARFCRYTDMGLYGGPDCFPPASGPIESVSSISSKQNPNIKFNKINLYAGTLRYAKTPPKI